MTTKEWARKIEAECDGMMPTLVSELLLASFDGLLEQWPEKINANKKWEVAGVRWGQDVHGARHLFPWLAGVVDRFSDVVVNAGYSVLRPGAEISPHKGYSGDVLRMHYGLICPAGDCGLEVEGTIYRWKRSEALLFDDTKEHSAWNRTSESRGIIIFDLKR